MQLLLRKIIGVSDGVQEYVDIELQGDDILIGSAPQSDIQLLDSGTGAHHARLKKVGERIVIRAEKGKSVQHGARAVTSVELQGGDEFQIGSQRFRCAAPPPGFDLLLEWHYVEMPGHLLANAYRSSLDDLGFSVRRSAWLLALMTLLLAGLAPLATHFWNSAELGEGEAHATLIASKMWLSGPLLPAHQVILGNDCKACHQNAFVQVKDEACQQCHTEVADHLNEFHPRVAELDTLGKFGDFSRFSCQNCHKEHNEPRSIVASSDKLCRNCHEHIEPAIAGFSATAHPPFRLSLLQPAVQQVAGTFAVDWQHSKLPPGPDVSEENHLKYPHDLHLDVEAVRHPRRDDALQCADCHRLSSDREHFEAISMEEHCSACHELSFDPKKPQKQLPHGSPQAVFDALEAHFVKQAFGEPADDDFQRRRLPGRDWQDDNCGPDYDCAREQALAEAERQFSQRGCVTCHQVDQMPGAEGVERWQVLPVRLNDDWYSAARFDHQSHLTQAKQRGDALCLSCHKADSSSDSSDILMPTLAQCVDCHGDKSVGGRVAVNCIACHGYHGDDGMPQSISQPAMKFTEAVDDMMRGLAHGEL